MHLKSALLWMSEKRDALLFIDAAARHMNDSVKEKEEPRCSAFLHSVIKVSCS